MDKQKWYELTPGWILPYEESFLESVARNLKEGARVVNIGAGPGTSTAALLRGVYHLESAHVLSIDIEDATAEMANLDRQGLLNLNRYNFHHGRSEDVGDTLEANLDLVFVDGEHSYVGVLNDLRSFGALLKPGGIIVCHDYKDPRQVEVTAAILDWLQEEMEEDREWIMIGQVLYTIAFMKPGGDMEWAKGRLGNEEEAEKEPVHKPVFLPVEEEEQGDVEGEI